MSKITDYHVLKNLILSRQTEALAGKLLDLKNTSVQRLLAILSYKPNVDTHAIQIDETEHSLIQDAVEMALCQGYTAALILLIQYGAPLSWDQNCMGVIGVEPSSEALPPMGILRLTRQDAQESHQVDLIPYLEAQTLSMDRERAYYAKKTLLQLEYFKKEALLATEYRVQYGRPTRLFFSYPGISSDLHQLMASYLSVEDAQRLYLESGAENLPRPRL